jgi:hypothetical protein
MGRPLHFNQAKNILMIGSRGYGKSYSVGAGVVAHEWLFDGMTHYTPEGIANPPAVEVIVGASDAKYSTDILDKTRACVEKLPGEFTTADKTIPSPLSKHYVGS